MNNLDAKCLIFANNEVSLMNAEFALEELSIKKSESVLFMLRPYFGTLSNYSHVSYINKRLNEHKLLDSIKSIFSYLKLVKDIRRYLKRDEISDILIVNNDNLLTNHTLRWVERNPRKIKVGVIAEGIMNYQDITIDNRSRFVLFLKKLLAVVLGLNFSNPKKHLSGSYEQVVDKVYTFSEKGLIAPKSKVVVNKNLGFKKKLTEAKRNSILVLFSGMFKNLEKDIYEIICKRLVSFVNGFKPEKIFIKQHPRCSGDPLLDYLQEYIEINKDASIERKIEEYPIGTVISICSTALVTTKILFSDIECIDFGMNIYSSYYSEVDSLTELYKDVGVRIVKA